MTKTITLYEALVGFEFVVTHLDKRKILIKSQPGEITRPKELKVVKDEGMPLHKNPFVKGKLFIEFDVKFPDSNQLGPEVGQKLRALLPQPVALTETKFDDEHEVVNITDNDIHEMNSGGRGGGGDYDEDGGHEGGQRVQCQQQ